MSTYLDDLKKSDPELARDVILVGNQPRFALRAMVRALSMCDWLNTDEDKARLAAARRILRKI